MKSTKDFEQVMKEKKASPRKRKTKPKAVEVSSLGYTYVELDANGNPIPVAEPTPEPTPAPTVAPVAEVQAPAQAPAQPATTSIDASKYLVKASEQKKPDNALQAAAALIKQTNAVSVRDELEKYKGWISAADEYEKKFIHGLTLSMSLNPAVGADPSVAKIVKQLQDSIKPYLEELEGIVKVLWG